MEKLKVLYIAGWGRSGSTLLGNLLGSIQGFAHLGEIRYLWDRGIIENWECGCGAPFSQCATWDRILEGFPKPRDEFARTMVDFRDHGFPSRYLLMSKQSAIRKAMGINPLIEAFTALYQKIPEVTGCRVLVDSSKFPSHAYLLDLLPNIDLYILHLVRDPRAVAFSWWKRQKSTNITGTNEALMARHHPFKSSIFWLEWNYMIQKVWGRKPSRYLLLRFEDFLASPKLSVQRILEMLGESSAEIPFLDERTAHIMRQHTVSGNTVRFQEGNVIIEKETRAGSLSWFHSAGVSLLCLPFLRTYGYRLFQFS